MMSAQSGPRGMSAMTSAFGGNVEVVHPGQNRRDLQAHIDALLALANHVIE